MKDFDLTPWFDKLVNYCQRQDRRRMPLVEIILHTCELYPVRRNLLTLQYWVTIFPPVRLRRVILTTISDILNHREPIRSEYRFLFHTYPKCQGQCSATSELFGLIHQAIIYHDWDTL